jgi:hypothetical protein
MIPISAYIGGGALLMGVLGGWTVRDWKADSDEAKAERKAFTQYTALTEALADQSLAYEYTVQDLRSGERRDRETIREIYRNVEIPAECAVPADAVSLLDNAIRDANASASRQPSGILPPAP